MTPEHFSLVRGSKPPFDSGFGAVTITRPIGVLPLVCRVTQGLLFGKVCFEPLACLTGSWRRHVLAFAALFRDQAPSENSTHL